MSPAQEHRDAMNPVDAETVQEGGALVIFGANGDLTRRKLVPALYNLLLDGLLPERCAIVGVGRKEFKLEAFRSLLREGIEAHSRQALAEESWNALAGRISYVCTGPGEVDDYRRLGEHLATVDADHGTGGNRLYYLSIPPSAFPSVIEKLKESGLNRPAEGGSWTRIVVEKPIGHDLESALVLNKTVNAAFHERDVFRIDHYLGKETVQNLLVFRFANAIFEPLWNQKYVDHVQITVAESIGVGGRGAYFEEAGTTRDMVQNHLFQLLCLTAMEPPVSLRPDAIRDEKVKVLQALRPVEPAAVGDSTVRGQYEAGVIDGQAVVGYKEEAGVAEDSRTETYVALRLLIDNWRWAGVPFYLRAGKRMNKRISEISVRFREVPHRLFTNDPPDANTLALQIQPDEGVLIRFDVKVPGTNPRIRSVDMDFHYGQAFGQEPPEAYERLLLDAILGDSTLFIRRDEVEAAWTYIDRLHQGWRGKSVDQPLPVYTAGTWGPAEAHVMLAQDRAKWRRW